MNVAVYVFLNVIYTKEAEMFICSIENIEQRNYYNNLTSHIATVPFKSVG